jgi:hypothetical protein
MGMNLYLVDKPSMDYGWFDEAAGGRLLAAGCTLAGRAAPAGARWFGT